MVAIGLIYIIMLTIVGAILGGWALSTTWGWFIVPTFGAPSIGLVPAIGVALVVGYLTRSIPRSSSKSGMAEGLAYATAEALLRPVLVVCIGWVVLQFM